MAYDNRKGCVRKNAKGVTHRRSVNDALDFAESIARKFALTYNFFANKSSTISVSDIAEIRTLRVDTMHRQALQRWEALQSFSLVQL